MTMRDVEIFHSSATLVLWLFACLMFLACCIFILMGIWPLADYPRRALWAVYLGLPLSALGAALVGLGLARSRVPVFVLSEAGVKVWAGSETIPWGRILSVETAEANGAKTGVALKLDEEFAKQIRRPGLSRTLSGASTSQFIHLSAAGIDIDELYRLTYALWDSRRDNKGSS